MRLSDFYASNQQGMGSGGLAVVRDKRVLDADALARGFGLRPGMGLGEAKILLRGGRLVEWRGGEYAAAQTQWLDVAADHTSFLEPEDQHTAYLDLSAHPDPLLVALRAVEAIRELGYTLEWGAAGTKWLAKIASRRGAESEPIRDQAGFLWNLPINALPISREAKDRFAMLGYCRVGQISGLSQTELAEQFGGEGLRIYALAWGGGHEPVRALHPKDSQSAERYFEAPLEDRFALERVTLRLAARLGAGLSGKDLSGHEVRMALDTESGVTALKRRFSKPFYDASTVEAAVRLLLKDFAEPVTGIRLTLPELSKPRRKQLVIGGEAGALESSLDAVRTVFGETAVRKASEAPVARRARLLEELKRETGWR